MGWETQIKSINTTHNVDHRAEYRHLTLRIRNIMKGHSHTGSANKSHAQSIKILLHANT